MPVALARSAHPLGDAGVTALEPIEHRQAGLVEIADDGLHLGVSPGVARKITVRPLLSFNT